MDDKSPDVGGRVARRSRSGGRAANAARRGGDLLKQMPWRLPVNHDRPIEPLDEQGVAAIHNGAMQILEETGIEFLNEEAQALFREAGCRVDGTNVKMGREWVMEMIHKAPNKFTITPRNPEHELVIGGKHILFGNIPNNQYVFVLDALDSLNYPYESGIDYIQLNDASYDAKTLIRSLHNERYLYGGYLGSYSFTYLDLEGLGGLASQEGWTSSNFRNLISEVKNNGASFIPKTEDIWNYLASNHDLIDVFGSDTNAALNHYLSSGAKEERVADNFDEWKYLASNPDLINIFGSDTNSATQHYVTNGYKEGRSQSSFNAVKYLENNADLAQTFGSDLNAATKHYVEFGYSEGRTVSATGSSSGSGSGGSSNLTDLEAYNYIASNPDLISAFGIDIEAAKSHYTNNGISEGRIWDSFSASDYLEKYSDLKAAFGNDQTLALKHYIQSGYAEGRTDSSSDSDSGSGSSSGSSSNLTDLEAYKYIASNNDLISAFGVDVEKIYYNTTGFQNIQGFDEVSTEITEPGISYAEDDANKSRPLWTGGFIGTGEFDISYVGDGNFVLTEQNNKYTDENAGIYFSANANFVLDYNFGIRVGNDDQNALRLGIAKGPWFFNVGNSFRKPNLYELNGDSYVTGNPELEPEEAIGVELGYGAVSIFKYEFEQAIEYTPGSSTDITTTVQEFDSANSPVGCVLDPTWTENDAATFDLIGCTYALVDKTNTTYIDPTYNNTGAYVTQGIRFNNTFGPVSVMLKYTDTEQTRIPKYAGALIYNQNFNGVDIQKNDQSQEIKVGPSESMSKSKKNTIDPGKMIEAYGADSVRFFILSDSPPEKDVQWSDSGMASSFKYIQKFWTLNEKICLMLKENQVDPNKDIDFFVNQAIDKINLALEKFRYNIIIAVFHEIYSFFNKTLEPNLNYSNLKENYEKILIMMLPVIPHLASECLEKIDKKTDVKWPIINKKFIKSDKSNIVIQINGKKRSIILVESGMKEKEILEKIKNDKLVDKYINGKNIFKSIYVQDKIINLIIK